MKKLLRPIRLVCIIVAAIFVLSVSAGAVGISVSERETDDIYATSRVYYLPSYVDITALEIDMSVSAYSVGGGAKVDYDGSAIDITSGKTTDQYGNVCYEVTFYIQNVSAVYTFYVLSEIPTVYIKTSEGLSYIHQNKNNRDGGAEILIVDQNGSVVYDDAARETNSEIKGRGNATWGYAKKPYQIKLGTKTDLFGMGRAKTWILLANYVDSSFIRNAVSYELADAVGAAYSPKSTFVNLYIDHEFYGLYQLIEKTQINTNRIEITDLEEATEAANKGVDLSSLRPVTVTSGSFIDSTPVVSYTYVSGVKNPEDITGGYLVEMDNIYGNRETSRFTTDKGNIYVIKSPEYASREQVEYIARLVSGMEDAVYSSDGYSYEGKHFSEYADMDSLIRMYMTYEMTKNWDAYVGSTFFYKDRDSGGETSKIYAGPAWDFDHAYGNLSRMTYRTDKTELWAAGTKRSDYCRFFGYYLISHPECAEKLAYYAKLAADCVYKMTSEGGFVDTLVSSIYDSASADKARWGYSRGGDFESFFNYIGNGTNSSIGFLVDFMNERTLGIYKYFVGADYVPPEPEPEPEPTTEATSATEPEPEPTTEHTATAETTAETTSPVTETTDAETENGGRGGGCGSSVGAAGGIAVVCAAGACALGKRKKENYDGAKK